MEHAVGLATSGETDAGALAVRPWRAFGDDSGWDALADRAAEPNPFAERWFVQAGLEAIGRGEQPLIAAFESGGKLAGLIPLARSLAYEGYPLPHIANWRHANAFLGTPLVAAGHEHAFWRALLGWADAHAGIALFLHLDLLPTGEPLFAALRDVCLVDARPAAVVHRHERAALQSDLAPEAYFEAAMSGKKRKELRRQFARLSELGALSFERRDDAEGIEPWCDTFLALERAGWKGAEGSALACNPATDRFFRTVLRRAATHGRLERLALTLDGRPVAMLANLIVPPGAFSFKTTYDEGLARFSPGVLLQRENLALLARDDIAWADSCAAPDHPMIERIWRERREIARVSIAIGGPARRAAAALLFRAETGAPLEGL
ncbi:GNAT family N-acetyltransferase [Tsuneonella litorea]|nr:GNAT family N-acetyltransferase [Tsuneonella litorea]